MFDPRLGERIVERISDIPVVKSLRMKILEFDDGYCKAVVPHDRRFDGIFNSYHGGLLTTAADSVACFAIMTVTGPDEILTTTDLHVRFLAPCMTDATVHARTIKVGRTLCPVAVDVFDDRETKVAVAHVTYIRLPSPPSHAPGAS